MIVIKQIRLNNDFFLLIKNKSFIYYKQLNYEKTFKKHYAGGQR